LNLTPFQALYGVAPPLISELSIPGPPELEATDFLQAKKQMLIELKAHLAQATTRMKKYVDNNRSKRTLQVGEMVYLKMKPYRMAAFGLRGAIKLHSKYYGPFRVLQAIGNRAYKLLLPEGVQIHPVFHVSQLKKHVGPTVVPCPNLPLVTAEGKIHTTPALVLQIRQIPRNNVPMVQWLIQWENLSPEEATWEDANFIKKVSIVFQVHSGRLARQRYNSLRTSSYLRRGHCHVDQDLHLQLSYGHHHLTPMAEIDSYCFAKLPDDLEL
jgi:hypothetical protein